MAEALVEAIFRRAQYTVARVGRETQMPALIRAGRAEFMPDFVVWRALDEPSLGHHSYRLLAIEVKYRADLADYLRRNSASRSPEVAQQWPELYEIIVTDRPEPARSWSTSRPCRSAPRPPPTISISCPPSTSTGERWRNTRGSSGRSSRSWEPETGDPGTEARVARDQGAGMLTGRGSRRLGCPGGVRPAISGGRARPAILTAIARRPPTSTGRA